ncbi:hypothetical protein EDC01DRAFT_776970 [Geopyxis carbonaria]|nr:hypothetical protein EDC01DRAFT_776970 [Geopyxis carbonaria]
MYPPAPAPPPVPAVPAPAPATTAPKKPTATKKKKNLLLPPASPSTAPVTPTVSTDVSSIPPALIPELLASCTSFPTRPHIDHLDSPTWETLFTQLQTHAPGTHGCTITAHPWSAASTEALLGALAAHSPALLERVYMSYHPSRRVLLASIMPQKWDMTPASILREAAREWLIAVAADTGNPAACSLLGSPRVLDCGVVSTPCSVLFHQDPREDSLPSIVVLAGVEESWNVLRLEAKAWLLEPPLEAPGGEDAPWQGARVSCVVVFKLTGPGGERDAATTAEIDATLLGMVDPAGKTLQALLQPLPPLSACPGWVEVWKRCHPTAAQPGGVYCAFNAAMWGRTGLTVPLSACDVFGPMGVPLTTPGGAARRYEMGLFWEYMAVDWKAVGEAQEALRLGDAVVARTRREQRRRAEEEFRGRQEEKRREAKRRRKEGKKKAAVAPGEAAPVAATTPAATPAAIPTTATATPAVTTVTPAIAAATPAIAAATPATATATPATATAAVT